MAGATALKRSNIILMTSGGRSFMESLISFFGVVGRAGGARRRGNERDLTLVYCQQAFQYISNTTHLEAVQGSSLVSW